MSKIILAITANPNGTSELKLDEELREIRISLKEATYREFEVKYLTATRWQDLHRAILESPQPRIVHFCGHGTGESGLLLDGDCGQRFAVSTEVLSDLFGTDRVSKSVECIVLNACYSAEQAAAISKHINYVIGMNRAIADDDAIAFTKGFYLALSEGCSISESYKQALVYMKAKWSGNGHSRDAELPPEIETTTIPIPEIYIKKELTLFPDPCGESKNPRLGESLSALPRLMSNPAVYQLVIVFRADLKRTYEQVELLDYHKELHDLLQLVETTCYWPILQCREKLMSNQSDFFLLELYKANLQSSITKARNLVKSRPEDFDEEPDWIDDLESVSSKLETAVNDSDTHDFIKALSSLGSILSIETTRLDCNLTDLAKSLNLPKLVKNLTTVRDKIKNLDIDESDDIVRFEKGILLLSDISSQLGQLIKEHSSWQRADSKLRIIRNNLDRDELYVEGLNDISELQKEIDNLSRDKPDQAIKILNQRRQALSDSLSLNDPKKVRSRFYSYYSAALDVFVQVDLALLDLCKKKLPQISEALAPVMEKLDELSRY